jgi:hypothetical protein
LRSNRSTQLSDPPIHRYDLTQRSIAVYWQQTLGITPKTDVSWGGRVQQTSLSARDRFDPNAPGAFFFDAQATPLNKDEQQHALHLGIERHRALDAERPEHADEIVERHRGTVVAALAPRLDCVHLFDAQSGVNLMP